MADDEVQTPPDPQRPATPNRGKRREPPVIDGRAEAIEPVPTDPVAGDGGVDDAAFDPLPAGGPGPDAHPAMGGGPADPIAPPSLDGPPDPVAAAVPPRSSAPRRSRLPLLLAALGVLLAVLLGGVLYALNHPSPDPAVAALTEQLDGLTRRVGALEGKAPPDLKPLADRVAALESKPAPAAPPPSEPPPPAPDFKPLDDRIAALEGTAAQVKADLGDLRGKLDQAAAAPTAAPASAASPPVDLGPLQKRVADLSDGLKAVQDAAAAAPKVDLAPLRNQVADLSDGLKAVQDKVSAAPKVDLAPLDGRVGDLGQKLAGVTAAVAALPRVDLAPVDAKVDALDHRLAPIEAELSASKVATQVTDARQNGSAAETRAAPLAVTGQAILQAVTDGRPFAPELAALQAIGADDRALAPLRTVADRGAPTRADLIALFDDKERAMVGTAAPAPSGGVLDRMVAGAQSLIKVRPSGATPGQDPDAVVTRIGDDLQRGDFARALAEWQGLPDDGKAATRPFADALQARVDAEAAARSVVSNAVAALGAAR